MDYKIDATKRSLGRVASEATQFLMGKNLPNFERNKVAESKVHIINASKIKINLTKLKTKEYIKYSGYPGGLKKKTMEEVVAKKGYTEILKKAIYGMLPSNKLRSIIIKNLTISE